MEAPLKLQKLGKYELIASLGQGGMANVYLALVAGPARFNKLLVLKFLREDVIAGMEEGVNMFLDEARLSARLVHPNIVHTYEVGEYEGSYFIAMEYLDGQSYRAIQRRARAIGGIPIHEELRVISETARGLDYAHRLKGYNEESLGVVHRDVSPQNVFISYDGQVKLLDFGIAKTSEAEHMTQVGVIKGKLDYIAPEQLRGEPLDGRADVFALGAMLWEAVTGKRFAGGRKVADVTKVHVRIAGTEPKVRTVQPDIPEPLAVLLERAIALRPDDRWPDAGAFADAIDAYIETTGQKPSAKNLAHFVMPLFEEERLKMRKLVEREVDKVKERGTNRQADASLPRIRLGEDSTSGVYVDGPSSLKITLDGAPPRSLAPLHASTHAQAKRSSRLRLALVGAAVVVAATVALAYPHHPDAESLAVAGAAPSQPLVPVSAAPAPEAPVAPSSAALPTGGLAPAALVSFTVKVTPEQARVTLDGAQIAAPFTGQFRSSAALHHVEVSAPGFRPEQRLVAFDQDRALDIVLDRIPDRAPTPAPTSRRAHPNANGKAVAQAPESPAPRVEEAAPPPASKQPSVGYGEDMPSSRPRVTRGRIDSTDPYATGN